MGARMHLGSRQPTPGPLLGRPLGRCAVFGGLRHLDKSLRLLRRGGRGLPGTRCVPQHIDGAVQRPVDEPARAQRVASLAVQLDDLLEQLAVAPHHREKPVPCIARAPGEKRGELGNGESGAGRGGKHELPFMKGTLDAGMPHDCGAVVLALCEEDLAATSFGEVRSETRPTIRGPRGAGRGIVLRRALPGPQAGA